MVMEGALTVDDIEDVPYLKRLGLSARAHRSSSKKIT